MKILHFSDLHVWRFAFDVRDPALKRFLGLANLLLRRGRAFPPAHARAVLDEVLRTPADLVVFTGDITTTALAREFQTAAELLQPVRRRWGDRFFLLPGNHDRYTPRTLRRRLYETYFDYAAFDASSGGVQTTVIDDRLAVVVFDSSVPRSIESTGLFTATQATALDGALERQAREGRRVILVGHFPYVAPPPVHIKKSHRLVGAERLRDVVARHRPVVYLHGHKHRRWAFRPSETPGTLCVNAGSAGLSAADPLRRAGFVVIELDSALRPHAVEAHVLGSTLAPAPSFQVFSFPIAG